MTKLIPALEKNTSLKKLVLPFWGDEIDEIVSRKGIHHITD